ncbi:unnamed protein product [Eruca vesicaria subsp. sativa]|uniref:Nucleolin 1-like n=1 Tax=Eruca vesicaria subsp. sativa TaxID=29727 RepID=A0ABC8JD54_ERUVS|nr:unnamed protein product [Eruca vesicaria subsp. sativa]
MVVEGYDTSLGREVVEEALKKNLASRGIKFIHVSVPTEYCRCALIYVNGECEAEALKLDGSDMGGRVLEIKAYPFDDNSLDYVFSPTDSFDKYRPHELKVTGFGTSLSRNDIKEMLCRVFPGSGCTPLGNGSALLYLNGQNALDEALKLSGSSMEGFKFAVTEVFPEVVTHVGISLQTAFGKSSYK